MGEEESLGGGGKLGEGFRGKLERKQLAEFRIDGVPQTGQDASSERDGPASVGTIAVPAQQDSIVRQEPHHVCLITRTFRTAYQIRHVTGKGQHPHLRHRLEQRLRTQILRQKMQAVQHQTQIFPCGRTLRRQKTGKLTEILRQRQPPDILAQTEENLFRPRLIDTIFLSSLKNAEFRITQ